ncbi:15761_t:CDS:1, partial [Gigaspora margarita]
MSRFACQTKPTYEISYMAGVSISPLKFICETRKEYVFENKDLKP